MISLTASLTLLLATIWIATDAHAISPGRCEYYKSLPSDVTSCQDKVKKDIDRHLQANRRAVYDIYKRQVDELCVFSSQVQIDSGRCQRAVQDLHDYLNQRKDKKAGRCYEMISQAKSCEECAKNPSALGCSQQGINNNQNHRAGSERWKRAQRELAQKVKEVEDALFEVSDAYAKNIQQNEMDLKSGATNSQAATKMGAASPSEALRMHGNESYSTVSGIIDQLKQAQDISQQQISQIEQVKSHYAAETMYLAAAAKSARIDMEKDIKTEDRRDAAIDKNTKTIQGNNEKLASVDPEASQSGVQGDTGNSAAGAAGGGIPTMGGGSGGAASGFSGGESAASETLMADGGTFNPNAGKADSNYMLNGVASPVGGTSNGSEIHVASAEMDAEGAIVNGTSSSRMLSRESLREKLAEQLARGSGGAVGTSQAAGGKTAGAKENSKAAAAAAKATPDMFVGFAAENFSGSPDSFSMAQSETDAAVKEMLSEFEGPADESVGAGRFLASSGASYSTPEILAADSTDLFHRTKEFYERCQKRGCVTR